jgi:hypothetical protein
MHFTICIWVCEDSDRPDLLCEYARQRLLSGHAAAIPRREYRLLVKESSGELRSSMDANTRRDVVPFNRIAILRVKTDIVR